MHGGGATPLAGAGVSLSRIQAIGRTLDSTLLFQAVLFYGRSIHDLLFASLGLRAPLVSSDLSFIHYLFYPSL